MKLLPDNFHFVLKKKNNKRQKQCKSAGMHVT